MSASRVRSELYGIQVTLHRLVEPALGLKHMAFVDQTCRVLPGPVRLNAVSAGQCSATEAIEYPHLVSFSR